MRIPSTTALRAFEAAVRLGSFSRAGAEMNLSHAAISRQIAGMEGTLGKLLFRRTGHGVEATEDALTFYMAVREALSVLTDGIQGLEAGGGDGLPLTVSVLPSLAIRWLMPRLDDFTRRHPDVTLSVRAELPIRPLGPTDSALAIRYGQGGWDDVHAHRLMDERLTPVCAPALLDRFGTPERVLREAPTLHDGDERHWEAWLTRAQRSRGRGSQEVFDDYLHVLELASAGFGLAMGRSALIARDLASRRLVAPWPIEAASPFGYYLVTSRAELGPSARRFRDWLLEQAAEVADRIAGS